MTVKYFLSASLALALSGVSAAVVHFCNSSSAIIYITITVMYYHITNKPFFTCDKVNILPVFYFSSVITTKIVVIFEKIFPSVRKSLPQSFKILFSVRQFIQRRADIAEPHLKNYDTAIIPFWQINTSQIFHKFSVFSILVSCQTEIYGYN